MEIKNPDKLFFPGVRKIDLWKYYETVSKEMLNWLRGRPLTLVRAPDGIFGEIFIQKELEAPLEKFWHFSESEGRPVFQLVCNTVEELKFLVNMGVVEFHITTSTVERIENPDLVLFDLDPFGVGFEDVKTVAFLIKAVLDKLGLRSLVKTSGGTGLHILVPIEPVYSFEQVKNFVQKVGIFVKSVYPDLLLKYIPVKERRGVLLDWNQNSFLKSFSAPFSVRVRERAPVSCPLSWKELETLTNPEELGMNAAIKHLGVWEKIKPQKLPPGWY